MTKEEATKYLRRFYDAIRRDPKLRVKIQKGMRTSDFEDFKKFQDKEITGLYDPIPKGRYKIFANPNKRRRGTMVSTIIHELLHHIEYDKSHKWLVPKEIAIYKALSNRQLTNLMKRVFD